MENKYYTPSIEEFHVGFEFERFIPKSNTTEEECWEKLPMSVNYLTLDELDEEIIENEIRVKYLDREDIESLGFKYINTCPIIGCTTYSFSLNSSVELLSGYASDHTECILIRQKTSCFHSNGVPVDKYLFQGYVKNKSELKMLLKMLGIN